MIDSTQIRKGMIIIMDGTLYRVMEMQLITPGRWKAMVQTKLRNIQNGSQTEHRFRSEAVSYTHLTLPTTPYV